MNEDCKTERSAPKRIAHTLALMQRDRMCRAMVSPSTVGEYASQIDDAFKEMQSEASRMTDKINALVVTLKRIIGLENQMQDSIQRTGYVTGGEAGHYLQKAFALAREALKKTFTECCVASNNRCSAARQCKRFGASEVERNKEDAVLKALPSGMKPLVSSFSESAGKGE